jgi:hypothetical protein
MLLAAGLAIFLTWLVAALVLTGIGSIALTPFDREHAAGDAFWMGLGMAVAALEVWNLFLPIALVAPIVLVILGLLGLAVNRAWFFKRVRARLQELHWLAAVFGAVVFFVAVRAAGPCDYTDTGLYGAQAVRWAMTYPAVPGLANLHGRLAFNSSVFLCIAALNNGLWNGLAYHLFTGFLLSAFCLTILRAWNRIGRGDGLVASDWFYMILGIPVVFSMARSKLVGTLTDEPTTVVCWVAVGLLFEWFCTREGENKNGTRYPIVVAATVLCVAVTFKLSAALFVLFAWCVALGALWSMKASQQKRRIYVTGVFAFSAAILVPWCIRGIILSGYPFYPSTILSAPVDWKQPAGMADWYAMGVRSFGRNPDAFFLTDTQGWEWIRLWMHQAIRNRVAFQVPIAIAAAGAALALLSGQRDKSVGRRAWLWLLLPSVAGLAFWFWASPDLRFVQFAIWTAAATSGAWGIVRVTSEASRWRVRAVLSGLLAMMMWCLISFGWRPPYRVLITSETLSPLPKVGYTGRYTLSELLVFLPTRDTSCWDSPLPCAAYFDEGLRLRDRRSIRWGFATNMSEGSIRRFWAAPIR